MNEWYVKICAIYSSTGRPKLLLKPVNQVFNNQAIKQQNFYSAVIATADLSVRPSVCHSVTFRCFVQTNDSRYDHAVFNIR